MTKSANRQPLGGSKNGIDEDITTARWEVNGDAIVQRQSGYSRISYFEGGGALQAGHLRILLSAGVALGWWCCCRRVEVPGVAPPVVSATSGSGTVPKMRTVGDLVLQ
jgi:hypothetical protein